MSAREFLSRMSWGLALALLVAPTAFACDTPVSVCATGKTVDEMLAIAKERMGNDPDTELRRAALEQRTITALRLDKLVLR